MKKRLLFTFVLVLSVCLMLPLLFSLGGCNTPKEKKLVLSHDSIIVETGKSEQLTAFYEGSDTPVEVTWTSSNSLSANVSASGVVTGVFKCEAVITATDSEGKTATCNVMVVNNKVISESVGSSTCNITGFDGIKEDIVIPSKVNGKTVVGIADGAFKDNADVKSITIPDTVKTIGSNAFDNCHNLIRIEIPISVEVIGSEAFNGCESLEEIIFLNEGSAAELTIGNSAFKGCWSIKELTLCDRIVAIGDSAFENLTSLESIYFNCADNVTIGANVFAGAGIYGKGITLTVASNKNLPSGTFVTNSEGVVTPKITELVFEAGITVLKSENSLPFVKKIVLPITVIIIHPELFNGCYELEEVVLPSGLKDGYHFDCWYTDLEVPSTKIDSETFDYVGNTNVLYAKWSPNLNTLTFDGNGATSGNVSEMKIHTDATENLSANEFTRVGYIFIGWSTTPDGKVEYEDGAIYTMGTKITCVLYAVWVDVTWHVISFDGNGASDGKMSLMYIKEGESSALEANVFTKVGYNFVGWSTTPNGAVEYEDEAVYTMGSQSTTTLYAVWEEAKYYVSYVIVGGQNNSDNVVEFTISDLPIALKGASMDGVSFDGWYTESSGNGTKVTEITECKNYVLYANWTSGTYGLQYALNGSEYTVTGYTSSTQYVVIPAVYKDLPVTGISSEAFSGKKTILSITLPSTIKSIGSYAFQNCYALKYISIPSAVTSIGSYAFYGCVSMQDLYIEDVGAWCNIAFSNAYSNPMYHADKIYLNGERVSEIVIPSTVETVKSMAFYYANLKSIVISEGVKSISSSAFNKSEIESITIPSTVTSIAGGAFVYASKLEKVYINSLESWCNISFGNSYSNPLSANASLYVNGELLEDLIIPNTVTSVNPYAFYAYQDLKSIKISNTVTTIGVYAFAQSKFVESVTYEENSSLETIGNYAFAYMANLIRVDIPGSIKTIGNSAFYNTAKAQIYVHAPKDAVSTGSSWNYVSAYVGSNYTSVPVIWDCENNKLGESHDDYEYGITVDGINYAVKEDYAKVVGTNVSGDVVIPSSITYNSKTYTVKIIGVAAFSYNYNLNSVIIPDSVTEIQNKAFVSCYALTKVVVPSSVTKVRNALFAGSFSVTVYIEAASQPSGWSQSIDWNNRGNINVIWDYKNKAPDLTVSDIVTVDGITYKLNGSSVIVKGITKITRDIIIPKTITYNSQVYTVSTIDEFLLDENRFVGSIFIPNTVKNIYSHAIFCCENIKIYCEATSSSGFSRNWNYDGGNPHLLYYYKDVYPDEDYDYYGYWHYVDGQVTRW